MPEVAILRCLLGVGGFVFEEAEAGGLEDGAVAEAAQPFDRVVVGHPRRDRPPVGKRVQAVRLGVAEGYAQPREVVGDATRARAWPRCCHGSWPCRRSGSPVGGPARPRARQTSWG